MKMIKQTVAAGKRLVFGGFEFHGPCEVDKEVADDVTPELLDEIPAPPEPPEVSKLLEAEGKVADPKTPQARSCDKTDCIFFSRVSRNSMPCCNCRNLTQGDYYTALQDCQSGR